MSAKRAVTEKQLRDEVIADIMEIAEFAKAKAAESDFYRNQAESRGKEIERLIRSLIWYESAYDELSDPAKQEFRAAIERVGKENEFVREGAEA